MDFIVVFDDPHQSSTARLPSDAAYWVVFVMGASYKLGVGIMRHPSTILRS
jgi:hypothetical protein